MSNPIQKTPMKMLFPVPCSDIQQCFIFVELQGNTQISKLSEDYFEYALTCVVVKPVWTPACAPLEFHWWAMCTWLGMCDVDWPEFNRKKKVGCWDFLNQNRAIVKQIRNCFAQARWQVGKGQFSDELFCFQARWYLSAMNILPKRGDN